MWGKRREAAVRQSRIKFQEYEMFTLTLNTEKKK